MRPSMLALATCVVFGCGGRGVGGDGDGSSSGSDSGSDSETSTESGDCPWTELAHGTESFQRATATALGDRDDDGVSELLVPDCGERPCIVPASSNDPIRLDATITEHGGVFLADEPMTWTRATRSVHDLDGDGVAEVAILEQDPGEDGYLVLAYSAGAWTQDQVELELVAGGFFGFGIASVPSVAGDASAELLVTRTYVDEGGGAEAWLVSVDAHGRTWDQLGQDPETLHLTGVDHMGEFAAGDLDGDGARDLVVGVHADPLGEGPVGVAIIWGPVAGGALDIEADLVDGADPRGVFIDAGHDARLYRPNLAAGGDLDGDGIEDLVIWQGRDVNLVRGSESLVGFGLPTAPPELASSIDLPEAWADPGDPTGGPGLSFVPDENDDGFDELLVVFGPRVRLMHGAYDDLSLGTAQSLLPPGCTLPAGDLTLGGLGAITGPGRQILLGVPEAEADGEMAAGRVGALGW